MSQFIVLARHIDASTWQLALTCFSLERGLLNGQMLTVAIQDGKLEDRLAAAGGVQDKVVDAIGAVLRDTELDGAFTAMAIGLPAATELIGTIPNIDPVLLHDVRCSPPLPILHQQRTFQWNLCS